MNGYVRHGFAMSFIHYTPEPIVDRIIHHTIGALLPHRNPQDLRDQPLRILEPACGHGIFLVKAYQYLLDWHLAWYCTHRPDDRQTLQRCSSGQWHLTQAERQRILHQSLYGVDLDLEAVQQTRRKLGQILQNSSQSLEEGGPLAGTPPWLDRQIQQGNSILPSEFNWGQAFPEVLTQPEPPLKAPHRYQGGFDVVLGNPPYLDSERMKAEFPQWRTYCNAHYQTAAGNWDLFCIFIEQAMNLCSPGGLVSLVVPNKLLSAGYAAATRHLLAGNHRLLAIYDYADCSGFHASVYPIVFIAQKAQPRPMASPPDLLLSPRPESPSPQWVRYEAVNRGETLPLDYGYFTQTDRPWPSGSDRQHRLIQRLQESCPRLDTLAQIQGAATVAEAYALQPLIREQKDCSPDALVLKVVNSGTLDRYCLLWGHKPLRYLGRTYQRPVIDQPDCLPPKRYHQATHPKLIIAGLSRHLECALDSQGTILAGKSTSILVSTLTLDYLLALLNSRLLSFFYRQVFGGDRLGGNYLRVGPPQLRTLPMPVGSAPQHSLPRSRAAIVAQLSDYGQTLSRLGQQRQLQWLEGADRGSLPEAIQTLERQVDELVYQLYQLSDADIALVEEREQISEGV